MMERPTLTLLSVTVLFQLFACSRQHVLFPEERDAGPSFPDTPWGRYAATLDVPPCPPERGLVVNTTDLEADHTDPTDPAMAGPELSITEALLIASNRPGPDTIRFDPDVFPIDEPTTIHMGLNPTLLIQMSEICIDGRDRGVVMEWPETAAGGVWTFRLREGSLLVGLTLLHIPYEISLFDSRIAGCRLQTDGRQTLVYPAARFWTVELNDGAIVGPGNVVSGNIAALRVMDTSTVRDNFFGYDPLTGANLELGRALDVQGDVELRGNVFLTTGTPITSASLGSGPPKLTLVENYFGVDRDGYALPASSDPTVGSHRGITLERSYGTIGPGNVIRGTDTAIGLGVGTAYWITENTITGNGAGIVHLVAPPLSPPEITEVGTDHVRGTCEQPGSIEVFVDPGDQGERFIGRAICEAETGFELGLREPLPPGMFVTATLTNASRSTSSFSAAWPVP